MSLAGHDPRRNAKITARQGAPLALALLEALGCSASSRDPRLLASGQQSPTSIALANGNAYWVNDTYAKYGGGGIIECATTGCDNAVTLLAQDFPSQLAVDRMDIYWATTAAYSNVPSVQRCSLSGCMPAEAITGHEGCPVHLAIDSTSIYWTNGAPAAATPRCSTPGQVTKCPLTGCGSSATLVAAGQASPSAIAVDASSVYWANVDDGTIVSCPLSGCGAPMVLAKGPPGPRGLAIDGLNIYWTNPMAGTVNKCALTGCNAATLLATDQNFPDAITVDASAVYFTTTGGDLVDEIGVGSVVRCPLDGCGAGGSRPQVLGSGQKGPRSIAVDATSVYWTNMDDGTVIRVQKP